MGTLRVQKVLALTLPILWALLPATAGPQEGKSKSSQKTQTAPAKTSSASKDPAQYVGAETSKAYHEDFYARLRSMP